MSKMSEFEVDLINNYIKKQNCYDLYQTFKKLPWYTGRQSQILIYGKLINIPRKIFSMGDIGVTYRYSGTTVACDNWSPEVLAIRDRLREEFKTDFNYCLFNFYETGQHYVSPHSDNEVGLNRNAIIASVSLGATRTMVFTRSDHQKRVYQLQNGSLMLMHPITNRYWKHSIIKEPKVLAGRINLTFRCLKTPGPNT